MRVLAILSINLQCFGVVFCERYPIVDGVVFMYADKASFLSECFSHLKRPLG